LPLVKPGGLIVADNVLSSGKVLNPQEADDHAIGPPQFRVWWNMLKIGIPAGAEFVMLSVYMESFTSSSGNSVRFACGDGADSAP
jgi:hypothetical protein